MPISRRAFVGGAAASALGLYLGLRSSGDAEAAPDGTFIRQVWGPGQVVKSIAIAPGTAGTNAFLFASMLPFGAYTKASGVTAIEDWYLWTWTHDSPRMTVFTAPHPTGPWTQRHVVPGPPGALPSGYNANHWSSGDIAWDADSKRLIATPHSIRFPPPLPGNGSAQQDSFVMQSNDGLTWSFISNDSGAPTNEPRLRCGAPGTPASVHTGYGRLLRALDGSLVRVQGKYWWIHRVQRLDDGPAAQPIYRVGLSSSPSLSAGSWTRETNELFPSPSGNLGALGFGSFVYSGSIGAETAAVVYAAGVPAGGGFVTRQFFNPSNNSVPITGYTGSGRPVLAPRTDLYSVPTDGAGYVVKYPGRPDQYMVNSGVRLSAATQQVDSSAIIVHTAIAV